MLSHGGCYTIDVEVGSGGFGGPGWCGGVKELIAFLVVVHMADAFTWFDPKDMKFGHMIAGK